MIMVLACIVVGKFFMDKINGALNFSSLNFTNAHDFNNTVYHVCYAYFAYLIL